jgi:TolB-like protein
MAVVVLAGMILASYFYFSRKSNGSIQSIAVMPFVNASGNADLDYLSDGMTETLIKRLSQLPNLRVKARSTVFRYKGKESEAKAIGSELGVPAILNGRMTQHADQLSLNLELIDTQTENVIWTDQYDGRLSDLVSLQSDIARDVSTKLKTRLSGADQQKLTKNYTNDPEAYRLYLQGRFYLNKRVGKLYDRSESYFRQAIEKDPNFALAYAALAEFNGERNRLKAKEYNTRVSGTRRSIVGRARDLRLSTDAGLRLRGFRTGIQTRYRTRSQQCSILPVEWFASYDAREIQRGIGFV